MPAIYLKPYLDNSLRPLSERKPPNAGGQQHGCIVRQVSFDNLTTCFTVYVQQPEPGTQVKIVIPSFSLAYQEAPSLVQAAASLEKEPNEKRLSTTESQKRPLPSMLIPRFHPSEVRTSKNLLASAAAIPRSHPSESSMAASKTNPNQSNMPSTMCNQMKPIQNQTVTVVNPVQKLKDFFNHLLRLASEQKPPDVAKTVKELVQSVLVSWICTCMVLHFY